MNCNTVQEKLALLVYDELSAEDARDVRAHLADCASCGAELKAINEARESLDQWEPIEADVPLRAVLDESVDDRTPVVATVAGGARRGRRWIPWTAGIAAGLALALTVLALGAEVSRDNGRLTISFGPAASARPSDTQPAALTDAQMKELKSMLLEQVDSNTSWGMEMVDERFNELENAQDDRFLALVHTIRTMREEDMQRFEDALTALALDTAQQTQQTRAALQDVAQQMAMRP